jgi:hypothetical protein
VKGATGPPGHEQRHDVVAPTSPGTVTRRTSGPAGPPIIVANGATVGAQIVATTARQRPTLTTRTRPTGPPASRPWRRLGPTTSGRFRLPSLRRRSAATASLGMEERHQVPQKAGVLGTTRTVAEFGGPGGLWPAVALNGSARVGVAWTRCSDLFCGRSELRWKESSTNGTTWYPTRIVVDPAVSSARRANELASVLWPSTTQRLILPPIPHHQVRRLSAGRRDGAPEAVAQPVRWSEMRDERDPILAFVVVVGKGRAAATASCRRPRSVGSPSRRGMRPTAGCPASDRFNPPDAPRPDIVDEPAVGAAPTPRRRSWGCGDAWT